ncbi:MAG: rhodanese-like domain-containing protein [Ignavibacteriae bacterium]|nr:rhodanese-like domain-containing protein [Ignavibacteriota bacterium]
MKDLRKLFYLLLIIPILFVQTGCSDDDETVDPPVVVNEAEVLVKYLEANGNPVNTFPVMIKSSDVNTNMTTNANHYIIDIRSAADFGVGHATGAVNVASTEVLAHYEANNLDSKDVVEIVCYSGQTAGWVTGLMHTMGHTNVKDMKWGMSSWSATTSTAWVNNISNARASQLVTSVTAKAAAGDLPTLNTGETEATDILRARVEAVFAEGFGAAKMANSGAFDTPANYYILNYWSTDHYAWGHIPGAIQYTPKADLNFDTFLTTLPTDKTIAVYCYTGQTSAHVSAYLRVLGYDAKSIVYGVNGMAHDTMPGTVFTAATDVHEYPLVQ